MNLYLLTFNQCDYDQYKAFVIAATSEAAAVEIVRAVQKPYGPQFSILSDEIAWAEGYTIALLAPQEAGIILSDYRAS